MITTLDPIDTPEKAETLRLLRNECAAWMTRDTRRISPEMQREFFEQKIATGKVEGFLIMDGSEAVAYALLVWDDEGRAWSSTGVKASRRGEGFGRIATVENAKRAHAKGVPIWAEVRRDNAGQQRICWTTGYRLVGVIDRDGVLVDVMRYDTLAPECA